MLRLYMDPISTTCRPILMFAEEAGIALTPAPVSLEKGEHMSAEFLAINPAHAIPVLDHDGFILTESSTILKYLADLHGSPAYPADIKARARVNEAMDWFNTGFYGAFGRGYVYPQVIDFFIWPTPEQQEAALERALMLAKDRFAQLEGRLALNGRFVCGETITLADYFGACLVSLGELVGFSLAPWPNVQAWMARMQTRPAWGNTHAAFNGWVAHCRSGN